MPSAELAPGRTMTSVMTAAWQLWNLASTWRSAGVEGLDGLAARGRGRRRLRRREPQAAGGGHRLQQLRTRGTAIDGDVARPRGGGHGAVGGGARRRPGIDVDAYPHGRLLS